MAKSKVSSKDTPRQEKDDDYVVSHFLFSDFYEGVTTFVDNIEHLTKTGSYKDGSETALCLIMDQIGGAKKMIADNLEKMEEELEGQDAAIQDKKLGQDDPKESKPTETIEDTKKEQSIFDDHRFWEYVAQIRIDKHNPADILEAWLKEHKPDYFEDSDRVVDFPGESDGSILEQIDTCLKSVSSLKDLAASVHTQLNEIDASLT